MTTKEQMLKARDLIRDKRYEEARAILEKIDHPKAHEWLEKINAFAPQKGSLRKKSASNMKGRQSNPLPLLLAGGLVVVVLGVVIVAFLFPALNGGPSSGENTNTGVNTDIAAQPTTAENPAADAESNNNATAVPAAESGEVTGSGFRIPFLAGDGLLTVELPQNWDCDCARTSPVLRQEGDFRSSVNARLMSFAFNPDYYLDKPITEMLTEEVDEDETLTAQETLQAGTREVLFVTVTDEDGDVERRYYLKDDDGYIIALTIPSYVDEPEPLHEFVLFMAENIDAEGADAAFEFSRRLTGNAIAFNAALNQWRFTDNLFADEEHIVELPANWAISCAMLGLRMAVKPDISTPTSTAMQIVPLSFLPSSDAPLAEILASFTQGNVIEAQASTVVNGREVVSANVTIPNTNNSASVYYIVRDSDGDVIALIIQPDVPDKAALHEDVLFMAGNIETQPIEYIEQLRRNGALEGAEPADDGFTTETSGCFDLSDL